MDQLTLQRIESQQTHNVSVLQSTGTTPAPNNTYTTTVKQANLKVPKLEPNDNIDTFLCSFERIMTDNKVPKDFWVGLLVPNLGTSKARDAYTDVHAPEIT